MVVRDYVALDESSDVFYKKYDFKEEFAHDYLYRFANKLVDRHIFSEEALDKSYKWELAPSAAQFDSLEATYGHMNFDYLLFISDFEVSSNNQTPLPDHTSGNTAYTVKAHMVLYDLKSRKKLLDFTSSGSDFAGAIVVYAPQAALASAINKSIERSIKYLEKKQ